MIGSVGWPGSDGADRLAVGRPMLASAVTTGLFILSAPLMRLMLACLPRQAPIGGSPEDVKRAIVTVC